MINSLLHGRRSKERPPDKRLGRLATCIHGLMFLLVQPGNAQQTRVILQNEKALVTRVEVASGNGYKMPDDKSGSVWAAIDPMLLEVTKDGAQTRKEVAAGEAEVARSGEHLVFQTEGGAPARLVIMKPKVVHQDFTIGPFILNTSIEDASSRNATLLIAVSDCRFTDIRNLGDESQWNPSKPEIITMRAGSARWIRPGIHHFKNLDSSAARLVSIEW